MKLKSFKIFFCAAIMAACLNLALTAYPAGNVAQAVPADVNMYVDKSRVVVDAYNINGFNYFKLRSLASSVNCGIGYDEQTKAIYVDTTKHFDASGSGGEEPSASGNVQAVQASAIIFVNGGEAFVDTFLIAGYNYFKLRDFIELVNMGITYDETSNSIYIATSLAKPLVTPAPSTQPATGDSFAAQVVKLVNAERAKSDISPLSMDGALMEAAQYKCQDMKDNNYFEHSSPTYGRPIELLKMFGVSYRATGENIASGQKSPAAVMESWMKSEGHRANIMSPDFGKIGVGYLQSGGLYGSLWAQVFTN